MVASGARDGAALGAAPDWSSSHFVGGPEMAERPAVGSDSGARHGGPTNLDARDPKGGAAAPQLRFAPFGGCLPVMGE